MFDFQGKTLLLTGASGGIAREVAILFYKAGASMVLSDIAAEPLEALARQLDPTGERVKTIVGDVTKVEDNAAMGRAGKGAFWGASTISFLPPAFTRNDL